MFTSPSYAKLNLSLHVKRKRCDGFHSLETLFERISLHDTLQFWPRKDGSISLSCSDPGLSCDEKNLCIRAARGLAAHCGCKKGVHMRLIKRIPVGAGLGGGSGNAACVLENLNRIWKCGLSRKELAKIGAGLGSDVPFFLYNCPFALGKGRGEKIFPLAELRRISLWHILIVPRINVPTPRIYRQWDKSASFRLTKTVPNVRILVSVLRGKTRKRLSDALHNSLEPVTVKLYPEVRQVSSCLRELGVETILMSGSGPAVFGIVSSRKESLRIARKLILRNRNWRVFCARTA